MATCKVIGAFNDKLNKSRLTFMIVMISLHETTIQSYCSRCWFDHENIENPFYFSSVLSHGHLIKSYNVI